MYSIQEMTHEEKIKMYDKLNKKELIAMIIEANRILSAQVPQIVYPSYPTYPDINQPIYTTELTCSQS